METMADFEEEINASFDSFRAGELDESWEVLMQAYEDRTVFNVKILTSVNGGVVTSVEGIRAFIPASQLSMEYVEDLDTFVGKKLDVVIITADPENEKLVLSAKELAKEKAEKEHAEKLDALQEGSVLEGVIDRIESYGCFVTIGDGLTGLVHISQICNKFLKSPNEVVKLGQTVKVKVLAVEDGKIRLSMKAAEDIAPEPEKEEEVSMEYHDEEATTSLAGLLAGIKLD